MQGLGGEAGEVFAEGEGGGGRAWRTVGGEGVERGLAGGLGGEVVRGWGWLLADAAEAGVGVVGGEDGGSVCLLIWLLVFVGWLVWEANICVLFLVCLGRRMGSFHVF